MSSPNQLRVGLIGCSYGEYATPQTIALNLDRPIAIQQKMVAELQEFAQAILENGQPFITVVDGRKVLQVLDAVILSGQRGQPVTLSKDLY